MGENSPKRERKKPGACGEDLKKHLFEFRA
jgi:hypothetical protein